MYVAEITGTGSDPAQEIISQVNVNWPRPANYTNKDVNDGVPHYRIYIQNTGSSGVALGSSGVSYGIDGFQLPTGKEVQLEAEGQWLWVVGDGTSNRVTLSILLIVV